MVGITHSVETTFGSDHCQEPESQTASNSREVVLFWIWESWGRCEVDKGSYFYFFLLFFLPFLGEALCQNPSLAIRKRRQCITHLVFKALCMRTNNTPLRRSRQPYIHNGWHWILGSAIPFPLRNTVLQHQHSVGGTRASSSLPPPCHIQGQVEWGSQQPDVVQDVPAHCRDHGLQSSLTTQTSLRFYGAISTQYSPLPPSFLCSFPLFPTPRSLFAPLLFSSWHFGEERKRTADGKTGMQLLLSLGAESQWNTALVLFLSHTGEFRIPHTVKVQNHLIVTKSHVRI